MAGIVGTITNLSDFLSKTQVCLSVKPNDPQQQIICLEADRKYSIPAFQREVRWDDNNLKMLLYDLSRSSKFLGNIILTIKSDHTCEIIDGQQRTTVLMLIVSCIKKKFGTKISTPDLCPLRNEGFTGFQTLLEKAFDQEAITSDDWNPTPNNKTIRHAIVTGETGEYGGFQKHSKMKLAQKWLEKFGGLENEEEGVNYQIAPFKVSSKCCYYLKEKPCSDWAKEHNCVPYLGLMASEGGRREKSLMLNGCNYFGKGTIRSAPFAIFNRQDLLQLALDLKVPVPEIYGSILKDEDGHLYTSGEQRTGCSMCGFGIQLEKRPHRFDRLRERNYKEWDFWMNRCCFDENGTPYGWGKVLDYLGIGWRDIPDPHNRKK